jgi:enamine deaminase RidA (YjgF/YER057c/UK114 family)
MNDQQPIPQGHYFPASRHADLIYTSGMTPRIKGELQFAGKVNAEEPLEIYQAAVELATSNALVAAESMLEEGERITRILQLQVFINAEKEFVSHAAMADFASGKIAEELGPDVIGSRAAIGVETLPGNAPVEIMLVAVVASI